ncbi:DoxX family membrane protein [Stackebrandtia nassauensis]|uniref:DoxX family protein n=1 Tax=Stackebrandtia nassauensis (strain DSM 44728 / CIP 108903 / NRRL B-16338 / NBRC 102104 / LLR-40K-21) TaxID=446470 RepID=D3PYN3_STANL|nr:DoxX family membrane protein [Stackebrandtia nassauensis]ADD43466.1 DoxX family protein [Stackebrandtia nassauensis DSM 44728]
MTDIASPTASTHESNDKPESPLSPFARVALALARICLGWIFLWAFLDKLLGLGRGTPSDGSWLDGNSPTAGYLGSVEGTFAGLFSAMSGQVWADWLFMLGMGGLGVSLILGIGMRVAAIGGIALLGMLWLSSLPLENNPFMDEHLVYLVTAIALAAARAGDTLGLGKAWARTPLVRALPFLR